MIVRLNKNQINMNKKNKADKKAIPLKRAYTRRNILNLEPPVAPFEIEKYPPNYRLNPDLEATLKRIDATLAIIKPGEAFVVGSKSRHSIKKHISEKYPNLVFVYSLIKDNKKMMRVYFHKNTNR